MNLIAHSTNPNTSTLYSSDISKHQVLSVLEEFGHCMIRGSHPKLEDFSNLIKTLCYEITYDPAREKSTEVTQKVNSGRDAIGLHIENGNTPKIPHLVAFYCRKAATKGSQTTICDGKALLERLPGSIKERFTQDIKVTRRLSEHQWKSYLAQEHPQLQSVEEVDFTHLQQMMKFYGNQQATLNDDRSINYELTIQPIRVSPLSQVRSFANALLGPSVNYQKPVYHFSDGEVISNDLLLEIQALAEPVTLEVDWQDNDILLVDNWRVMHGRRAILDAGNRDLYIGMGDLL